jgi:hypothetical protein
MFHVGRINAVDAFVGSQLRFGAALRFGPVVGRVLGSPWRWVFEAFQGSFNASRHGDAACAILAAPPQG